MTIMRIRVSYKTIFDFILQKKFSVPVFSAMLYQRTSLFKNIKAFKTAVTGKYFNDRLYIFMRTNPPFIFTQLSGIVKMRMADIIFPFQSIPYFSYIRPFGPADFFI